MTIKYVVGLERLIHAEFVAFLTACPKEGGDAMAILNHVGVGGFASLDASRRDGFGIARPYCNQVAGWGVFFEIEGPWRGDCVVTILLVAKFDQIPFELFKRKASDRWIGRPV